MNRIGLAVVVFVGVLLVFLSSVSDVEARRRGWIPLPLDWGGEKLVKLGEFPDTDRFRTSDGKYYDIGAIYKQLRVLWIPVWNYDIRWIGYVAEDSYVDVDRSDLKRLARIAGVGFPSEIELPFWDSYGGKIIFLFGFVVLWRWLASLGGKDETEELD